MTSLPAQCLAPPALWRRRQGQGGVEAGAASNLQLVAAFQIENFAGFI
jgi:hypothetical protein